MNDHSGNPVVSLVGSTVAAPVASGTGNTVIKASPGTIVTVVVTTTGTASAGTTTNFYDSATTNSGTVLFAVPGNAAAGTSYQVNMPAAAGITVAGVSNGPALTVAFN